MNAHGLLAWLITCAWIATTGASLADDWTQFRGPLSNSVSQEKLAIDWSDPNIVLWKSALPGRGPSSPIVVADRVFVTASSGVNQERLHVLCFDANTGSKLWERQFWATGRAITHTTSANAAPTPASDGERVFAFYSSNDLVALDLNGNLLWYRGLALDYPRTGNDVGMSSSPVVSNGTVVVQVENQGNSFAAGINTETGENRWRIEREPVAAWSSPILAHNPNRKDEAVLLQSADRVTAHDLLSGSELWIHKAACSGIPSAAAVDGIVYLPADGMTAIDVKASNGSPNVLWNANSLLPGAASPLVDDGRLYVINRSGVLNVADTKTGENLWKLRLEGSFWSTPALVDHQLICAAENGLLQVVELPTDGTAGKIAAKVDLGEKIQSSPAVVNGSVYLRSDGHLFKLGTSTNH
jgi:outer membrane protein assembly factor BamB